jgi:hypothetical protein
MHRMNSEGKSRSDFPLITHPSNMTCPSLQQTNHSGQCVSVHVFLLVNMLAFLHVHIEHPNILYIALYVYGKCQNLCNHVTMLSPWPGPCLFLYAWVKLRLTVMYTMIVSTFSLETGSLETPWSLTRIVR